jgi:phosphate transport system substrate-binding protein
MTRTPLTLVAVAVLALVGACGKGTSGRSAEIITIDGSSTVFPVTEAVAEAFRVKAPDIRITVGESGTGSGFQKFCRNETDISDASRPIKAAELEACTKAGITVIELPIAYDGLAVVVNPKNTWAASMTVAELRKLWEPAAQGTITRWSQVRPGWPNREIHLFGPGTASGTFDYFTEVINGTTQKSRGDYTASEDDNVLVQGVAGDEAALGYFGLAYYEQNKDKLKLVPVDDEKAENGAGPISPSFETVRGGTYQPLSRPLFIYVNVADLARPEVAQFIEFYLQSDAEMMRRVGYVPLADAEQTLVRQRFANRTAGTMFTGAPATAKLEELLRAR